MEKSWIFVFVVALAFTWDKVNCSVCIDGGILIKEMYTCAEYIDLDPCHCKTTVDELDINVVCCASCSHANVDNCCKDRITPNDPIDIGGGKSLSSCDMVKSDYQALCKQDIMSGEMGLCCATCSMIDLDCLNANARFNEMYNCEEFVAMDPCNCELTFNKNKVADLCCAACKDADTSDCDCTDNLGELTYTIKHPNKTTEVREYTSCADVVENEPHLCSTTVKDSCCKSCENVCEDNPYYFTKVKNQKTGKKCKGCSCQQIKEFDMKTAMTQCKKKGKKKVGTNCCKMCSEL